MLFCEITELKIPWLIIKTVAHIPVIAICSRMQAGGECERATGTPEWMGGPTHFRESVLLNGSFRTTVSFRFHYSFT